MSKSKIEKSLTIRDRSKDIELTRMSSKYALGQEVLIHPLNDNKYSIIEILKFNLDDWSKMLSLIFNINKIDTSKKTRGRICGFVVENGVTKYLLNKSVKDIFTVTEKQIIESKK